MNGNFNDLISYIKQNIFIIFNNDFSKLLFTSESLLLLQN